MARLATAPPERAGRHDRERVDKFAVRRDELADAALQTLGELGYARTSLREIAQKSAYSHGVLHYYFRDKTELVTYCVRRYKESCVTKYDDLVATAQTAEQLRDGFADALVDTMLDDAPMHRLWYDMRSQAMFEEALRPTVVDIDRQLLEMIWRVITAYSRLLGHEPTVTPVLAYAVVDGLFENCLLGFTAGEKDAERRLREGAAALLPRLFGS